MTGREKSIIHRRDVERQLEEQRKTLDYAASMPNAVSMSDQALNHRSQEPRDIEKIEAAQRKRSRKRNRGW